MQVAQWLIQTLLVDPLVRTFKKKSPWMVAKQNESWEVLEFLESCPVIIAELVQDEVRCFFFFVCVCIRMKILFAFNFF